MHWFVGAFIFCVATSQASCTLHWPLSICLHGAGGLSMSRHPGPAIFDATLLPFLRFAFWQDFHFIVVVCQKVAECVTFPFCHPLTILRSPEHVPVGILRSHYVINPSIHVRNTKHELIIYVHGCYIVNRASTCVLALFFCVVTSFVICTPHETRGLLRWSEQDVIGCGMRHVLGGRGFTWRTLMERSRSEDTVMHRDNIKMDHKTGWEGVDWIKPHETCVRMQTVLSCAGSPNTALASQALW